MVYSPFMQPKIDPRILALMPDPSQINMVAAGPPKRPGLLDRIVGGLGRGLMQEPAGGLLTEQDIKNARAQGLLGMGSSLLAGGAPKVAGEARGTLGNIGAALQDGQKAYQGAVGGAADMIGAQQNMQLAKQRQQMQQLELQQGQQGIAQAEAVRQQRQRLIAENPLPADAGGMTSWAEKMLPKFMQVGDDEYVQRLTAILATRGDQQKEPGQWVEVTGPDGKPMTRYVTASQAGQGLPIHEKPQRGGGADPRPITLVNPATGKAEVALYDPEAGDFRFTGHTPATIGAGSESERKAQALYELAAPHVELLDAADAPNRIEQLAMNGKLNEVLESNRQMWELSGKQIAEAYLRLTTGAAYNKEELENAVDQVTPRPGNTPEVIAMKRANRQRLMRALRAAAGRAWQESPDMAGNEFSGVSSGGSSTAGSGTANVNGLRSKYGSIR